MGSEKPVPSPFGGSDLPKASAQQPPAPQQPEPPRLGILHLMVLTACVAGHLGLTRARSLMIPLMITGQAAVGPPGVFEAAAGTVHGIGSGAALAGLVLLVARRRRGFSFPVYPGEYLLVLVGFGVLARWANLACVCLIASFRGPAVVLSSFDAFLLHGLPFVLYASIFLWAVIRVKIPRWRIFLLAIPAGHVLLLFLVRLSGGLYRLQIWALAPPLLVSIVLIVAVLKDHFDGRRYPWTHWFGVTTRLWLDASAIGVSLWYEWFARPVSFLQ